MELTGAGCQVEEEEDEAEAAAAGGLGGTTAAAVPWENKRGSQRAG